MAKKTIYEIKGICPEIPGLEISQGEGWAESTEKVILDLGKIVNELANTDHQIVSFHPLTTYDSRFDFCNNHERSARIGYCFDFRNGKAYMAFSGEVDAKIARQILTDEGYKIKKIKKIPGIVFSDVEYKKDKEGRDGMKEKKLARDVAERRVIEARQEREHALKIRDYETAAATQPKTSLYTVLAKRIERKDLDLREIRDLKRENVVTLSEAESLRDLLRAKNAGPIMSRESRGSYRAVAV